MVAVLCNINFNARSGVATGSAHMHDNNIMYNYMYM